MLSARLAIDIIFIALVIVAVSITVVVAVRALGDTSTNQAQRTESLQQESNTLESLRLELTDPDTDTEETGDQYLEFGRSSAQVAGQNPADRLTSAIYGSWPFILPITWGAVVGTLVWRGKVRSAWSRQGYDYDTFRLVTKMRGSQTRIRLLNALSDPKNKLQLAKELEVDWKTIDNHMEMLLQSRLVEERTVVGTTRYYAITASGEKVLSLLSGDKVGSS